MKPTLISRLRSFYVQATTVDPLAKAIFDNNKTELASSRGWLKPSF